MAKKAKVSDGSGGVAPPTSTEMASVQGVPAEDDDRPVYVPATVDREAAQAVLGGVLPPQTFGPPNVVEEPDGIKRERDRLGYLRAGSRSRFNTYNHLAGQALARVNEAKGEGYRRHAQRELTSILREQRAETEMLVKLGEKIIEYGLMLGEDVTGGGGVPKEAKDGEAVAKEKVREGRVLPLDPVSARAAARMSQSSADAKSMSERVVKAGVDGVGELDEEEAEAMEDAEEYDS